jgi:hypothetical protein
VTGAKLFAFTLSHTFHTDNLGTIKWLLANSTAWTPAGWMHLVGRIRDTKNDLDVTKPEKPENPLERLMVGWTGRRLDSYKMDRPVFCALKMFGINVANHLILETMKNHYWKDYIFSLMNRLRKQYEQKCGGKKFLFKFFFFETWEFNVILFERRKKLSGGAKTDNNIF